MVEAEDYKFSVKLYKFENQETFLEDYNNGLLEEVPANGVVDAGQKIAVGVYVETKNATASAFDLRLNWDDSILDPIMFDENRGWIRIPLLSENAGGMFPPCAEEEEDYYCTDWQASYSRAIPVRINGIARIGVQINDSNMSTYFQKTGIMYWHWFYVKENISSGSNFTFGFNRAEGFANLGRNEVNIITTPVTFKVSNPIERYSVGDINGNGKIDYGDVLVLIAYVGRDTILSDEERAAADINGDGKVNLLDQTAFKNQFKTHI